MAGFWRPGGSGWDTGYGYDAYGYDAYSQGPWTDMVRECCMWILIIYLIMAYG